MPAPEPNPAAVGVSVRVWSALICATTYPWIDCGPAGAAFADILQPINAARSNPGSHTRTRYFVSFGLICRSYNETLTSRRLTKSDRGLRHGRPANPTPTPAD